MSKVMTFSRVFPSYHPKAGQPTFFVEKICNSLKIEFAHRNYIGQLNELNPDKKEILSSFFFDSNINYREGKEKHHTIRAGNRFKVGDKFSPRVWSGKPYRSAQIIIAPDIEVKKVWDFEIVFLSTGDHHASPHYFINDELVGDMDELVKNDGLNQQELEDWFLKPGQRFIVNIPIFKGQIICWNKNINY